MKKNNLNEKIKQYQDMLFKHEDFAGSRNMFDKQQFIPLVYGSFDSTAIEELGIDADRDIFNSLLPATEPAEKLALIVESCWEKDSPYAELEGSTYSLEKNGSVPSEWNPSVKELNRIHENYETYNVSHSPNQEIGTILRLRIARILYHLSEILSNSDDDFSLFFREYLLKELYLVEDSIERDLLSGDRSLGNSIASPGQYNHLPDFFYINETSGTRLWRNFIEKTIDEEAKDERTLKDFLQELNYLASSLEGMDRFCVSEYLRSDTIESEIDALTNAYLSVLSEITDFFHRTSLITESFNSSSELSEYLQELISIQEEIKTSIDDIKLIDVSIKPIESQFLLADYNVDSYEGGEDDLKYKLDVMSANYNDLYRNISFVIEDFVNAIKSRISNKEEDFSSESYSLLNELKIALQAQVNSKTIKAEQIYNIIADEKLTKSSAYRSAIKLLLVKITGKDDPLSIAAGLVEMLSIGSPTTIADNRRTRNQWLFKMINYLEIAISHYLRDTVEINQLVFSDVPIILSETKITSISDWSIKMLRNIEVDLDSRYPTHPFICEQLKKEGWQNFLAKLINDPFYEDYIKIARKLPSAFGEKKNKLLNKTSQGFAIDIFNNFYNTFSYKDFIRSLDLSKEVIETDEWNVPIIFKAPIWILPKYNWFETFLVDKAGTYVDTTEDSANILSRLFSDRNIYLFDLMFLNPSATPNALIDQKNLGIEDDLVTKIYLRLDKMGIQYDSLAVGEIRNTSRGWLINQCLIAEQRLEKIKQVPGWLDLYRFLRGDNPNLIAKNRSKLECDMRGSNILEEILGTLTNGSGNREYSNEYSYTNDPIDIAEDLIDYMLWSLGYGDSSIDSTSNIDRIEAAFRLDYGHYCFHSRLKEMINWMIFSPGMYFTSALGEYFYDSHLLETCMESLNVDEIPQ